MPETSWSSAGLIPYTIYEQSTKDPGVFQKSPRIETPHPPGQPVPVLAHMKKEFLDVQKERPVYIYIHLMVKEKHS